MSRLVKRVRQVPSGTILPLHEVRRLAVTDAIDKCGGNYVLAAKMLEVGRTTIYRWVHTHGDGCPEAHAAAFTVAKPGMKGNSLSSEHDKRNSVRETATACGPTLRRVG